MKLTMHVSDDRLAGLVDAAGVGAYDWEVAQVCAELLARRAGERQREHDQTSRQCEQRLTSGGDDDER